MSTHIEAPLVSIGMPVFNCESTLISAVRSIINQTYQHWELLLIDDGSTDRTAHIARRFADPRIRLVVGDKNLGLPTRLNHAVALSRGVYFARMDGDDIAFPRRLETQVSYLAQHSDVDLIGTGMIVFRGEGDAIGVRNTRESHEWICRNPSGGFPMAHGTWMGKMDWFRRNPYDPRAVRCEDQELLLRTYQKSRFAGLEAVTLGFREEDLSLKKIAPGRLNYLRALARQLTPEHRFVEIVIAYAKSSLKMLLDTIAVVTGLNYKLLRHRATKTPVCVAEEWHRVWLATTQAL